MNILEILRLTNKPVLPIVRQAEAAECGLACLCMIAQWYGFKIDLRTLRREHAVTLRGLHLKQLLEIAHHIGLLGRALRIELDHLSELQLPALLHWNFNHFVVLKKIYRGKISIHDPALGEQILSLEEFSKHFTGIAVEFNPTASPKNLPPIERLHLSQLWTRFIGWKKALTQVLILSLGLQLLSLFTPFYLQFVLDDVIISHDWDLMKALAIGFCCMVFLQTGVTTLRTLCLQVISAQLHLQLGTNLFRHLLYLPLTFFERRHIGDILSRFSSVTAIRNILGEKLAEICIDGLLLIITLSVMLFYSPLLTSIVLGTSLFYLALRLSLYPLVRMRTEAYLVADAEENTHFYESIRSIQCLKLFGREIDRLTLWLNRYAESLNTNLSKQRLELFLSSMSLLLFGLEHIVVVYLGAHMVLHQTLTVGMLTAFLAYSLQCSKKIHEFSEKYFEWKLLDLHLERLADIALAKGENLQTHSLGLHHQVQGALEVRDLAFRYGPQEPWLFKHLHFKIQAGESVALVGPSGCGKSTLLKCLLGLLPIEEGHIIVDGMELQASNIRTYRQQIAAVMQDDTLLSGSLAENISFFDSNPHHERIVQSALLAAIHEDILKMPMGYNSLVGEGGAGLSGGQRQRILIARALYRNPRILLMDEATSHLDIATEESVNRAIAGLRITRIIVAHRPETIRSADRIIHLLPEDAPIARTPLEHAS